MKPFSTKPSAPADRNPQALKAEPLTRIRGLSKSFGTLRVLDNVNLDFEKGGTTVVLGLSGTGKSVLLKLMVGLLSPDAGEIYFSGDRIDNLTGPRLDKVRTQIGFLFQMGALFDSMTVAQNVCFPLVEHTSMSPDQRGQRCRRVLGLVDMDGTQSKMPAELSGGQRKRVALARAIALHPRLICYDEPTTGLDPINADVINKLIVKLQQELKATSIVVTHDMHSAFRVADRMIMLYDGAIVADAPPDRFRREDHQTVREFFRGSEGVEMLGNRALQRDVKPPD